MAMHWEDDCSDFSDWAKQNWDEVFEISTDQANDESHSIHVWHIADPDPIVNAQRDGDDSLDTVTYYVRCAFGADIIPQDDWTGAISYDGWFLPGVSFGGSGTPYAFGFSSPGVFYDTGDVLTVFNPDLDSDYTSIEAGAWHQMVASGVVDTSTGDYEWSTYIDGDFFYTTSGNDGSVDPPSGAEFTGSFYTKIGLYMDQISYWDSFPPDMTLGTWNNPGGPVVSSFTPVTISY